MMGSRAAFLGARVVDVRAGLRRVGFAGPRSRDLEPRERITPLSLLVQHHLPAARCSPKGEKMCSRRRAVLSLQHASCRGAISRNLQLRAVGACTFLCLALLLRFIDLGFHLRYLSWSLTFPVPRMAIAAKTRGLSRHLVLHGHRPIS